MITEHDISEGFGSAWHAILPMLTPSFMALFNESHVRPIIDKAGEPVSKIELAPTTADPGLISETAFYICKLAHEKQNSIDNALAHPQIREEASRFALTVLKSVTRLAAGKDTLDKAAWNQVRQLCDRYQLFLDMQIQLTIEFAPRLRGSGFLGACSADLSIGPNLYEIKTVTRNFAANDLRQVLVYLALQRATGTRRWEYLGLLNPRRGVFANVSVDYILYKLSGGRSAQEVLDDILGLLATRGIEIDSTF